MDLAMIEDTEQTGNRPVAAHYRAWLEPARSTADPFCRLDCRQMA